MFASPSDFTRSSSPRSPQKDVMLILKQIAVFNANTRCGLRSATTKASCKGWLILRNQTHNSRCGFLTPIPIVSPAGFPEVVTRPEMLWESRHTQLKRLYRVVTSPKAAGVY